MLIHPWDQASDHEWGEVLSRHDFGTFIATGTGNYPVAVPTHFVYDEGTVHTHFAKPNPVWAALKANPHAMLVINADWAYIEAAWNSEDAEHGVPTSYYTSVQLLGRVELVSDPDELAQLLTSQLTRFEPVTSTRVPVATSHEPDRRQLKAIRGVRMHIVEVRAKQKYGGNRSLEHRGAVADHLLTRGAPGDAAAREHVLRRNQSH